MGNTFTALEARAYSYLERCLKRRLTLEEKAILKGEIVPGTGDLFRDATDMMFEQGWSFEGEKGMTNFRTIYLNMVADRREKEWRDEKAQLTNTEILDAITGTAGSGNRRTSNQSQPRRLGEHL